MMFKNPSISSSLDVRLTRAALCLFAFAAAVLAPAEARAQWTTAGANTTTTSNVGVGTAAPDARLTVSDNTAAAPSGQPGTAAHFVGANGAVVRLLVDSFGGNMASIDMRRANNTAASPTALLAGNGIGQITWQGYGATSYSGASRAKISAYAAENYTDTAQGAYMTFAVAPRGGITAVEAMRIDAGGNVGIGTTTPATAKLVISGTAGLTGLDLSSTDQYAEMRVIRNSLNPGDKDLYLQWMAGAGSKTHFYSDNAETMTINAGRVGIGTAAPASALHVAGNITVDGNINAKWQDVAEWVPSTQQLAAGTVVVLDAARANHVAASAKAYDTRVAGVVSARPGIALGEAGEGKALVATTGRVKVKVDATRAPVRIGDLIVTSDVAGVAMRSEPVSFGGVEMHRPGTIIGKALEPLEKGTGEILVLLSLQ